MGKIQEMRFFRNPCKIFNKLNEVSYRFPPTLDAAFCTTLAALALAGCLALAGAVAFFVAFCAFFCSLAALKKIIVKFFTYLE